MKDLEEVISVVRTINNEISFDDEQADVRLFYTSDGYNINIMFFDHCIWCSYEDERKYDEETDCYEPILKYVRRELFSYINKMNRVKGLIRNA